MAAHHEVRPLGGSAGAHRGRYRARTVRGVLVMLLRKSPEVIALEAQLALLGKGREAAVAIRDASLELKRHLDEEWVKVESRLRAERSKQRG